MRKKFLLMIFVLSLFSSGGGWLHAQTKNGVSSTSAETITLFEDDFNDGNLDGWRLIDGNNDGNNWYLDTEKGWVISKSYQIATYPQDYIVTESKYTLSESSVLSLRIGPAHKSYNDNTYKVVISEDISKNISEWDIVLEENFRNSNNIQEIVEKTIDLSDDKNRTVYIGVYHSYGEEFDGTGVILDYIKLTGAAPAAEPVAKIGDTPYNSLAEAVTAVQVGETITLIDNVVLAERVTIPADKTLTIDLNGKSISMEESIIATAYAINNLGNLTITDGVGGGSINARGVYNGYGDGAANVATAKITVLSGTINAKGTNGGAAVYNYGIAEIKGGTFTSIGGYSLNSQSGASMTIADGVTANNGIYVSGATLVVDGGEISGNRSGCHVLYAWNSTVTIEGGEFYNNNSGNSTTMAGGTTKLTINGGTFSIANGKSTNGWTSCLIDATDGGKYEINGGEFKGHFRVQANCAMEINGGTFENTHGEAYVNGGTVAVKGGTFTDAVAQKFATDNLADGYELGANGTVAEVVPAAKIGETPYTSFADALNTAKSMTGDVTVEICAKVTMNQPLTGSYTSIKFVGPKTRNNADAEIYLDVQGYTTATGKKVAFENLKLSKSEGGYITNAGFMNVAFGIYDVAEVSYTNCTFLNGACASFGKVTYTDCTFYRSWDKYGLWTYGNVDVTVEGCTFADYRGIKMYVEGGATSVEKPNLVVKSTDFSAVSDKPAIVLTYGESVELEGNTYSSKGVFELDLDGAPNGVAVKSDVAPTCTNDNGKCGVLVDGKIYTTVAQAAEVATSTSTVTLLHNSTETVEFPMGTTINKNGFTADNVTTTQPFADYVVLPSSMNENNYKTLFGTNTVTDGTNYYATLQAATEAVAGTANAVLYCKPNANVGSLQHAPVTSTLTVYGNNANVINGGERDFDLGNTDPNGGRDITADMTLTVKRLNGCGAWGAKATAHTVNLVFENCYNMGKVFISGTTGTLNITMTDCAFEGVLPEAIYSNADGAISLNNVAFSNLNKAVNLNHKAAGTQTVTINGCSFTNCGADVTKDEIPVRVLTSVAGGNTVLAVSNTTFSGTIAGGADILLPNDKGITDARIQTTAANVKEGTAEMKNITASDVYEYSNAVAQIGTTPYTSLDAAVQAAKAGDKIQLLADADLAFSHKPQYNNVYASEIDLNGKTMTIKKGDVRFDKVTIKNGNIVVEPGTYNGTAIFLMYSKDLTFDAVKVTATGVATSAYLIGLEGTSNLVLEESEIIVNNESLVNIGSIIADNGNGNTVTIKNSKIDIKNSDARLYLGGKNGNITVENSDIDLNGVKEGFYLRAGQKLAITGNSTVDITLNSNEGRYGINLTDITATYTKAETATVNATIHEVKAVAQIGTAKYASIQKAVEAAVLMSGDVTIEILEGTHAENINLTNAAVTVGSVNTRPNITFKPAAGADVTLAGKTTLGYYERSVGASRWNGKVTFEGIKFDHAANASNSLDIQDLLGVYLVDCILTGDGEYGITSSAGTSTSNAAFTGCTFNNGGMQVLGQLGAHLAVNNCVCNNFSFNLQGGAVPGMTIKNTTFNMTLTDAHVGESFYAVRTNAVPVNIEGTTFTVDSEVSSVAVDQAKWGLLWARKDSNLKWNITGCEVNFTDAAMAQTELLLTKNDASYNNAKERIVITNLTSTSNEVADLAKRTEGCASINNVKYLNGELDLTGMVAKVGNTPYASLAEALTAAADGETVNLLWSEGNAPIAMNGAVFGKNVTISGTAKVDWSKGFLFVGRGGAGNATLTFDGANLTSASNQATYGIHVSGREKNTTNKYDGTLVIKNSTIDLDYLINRGEIKLDEGAVLTVKNGFGIAGRPASETENGADATATITLENNAKLVVNNHNGMGLGQAAATLEGYGVMNVNSGSTFETTQSFLVTAKGTMNIAGTAIVAGTLTNKGAINLTAENASLTAQAGLTVNSTVDGRDVIYANGVYTTKLGLKGAGTESEPYLIASVEELEAFRASVNEGETKYNAPGVYVALNADIDLTGTTWEHGIGDGINATFDGIFDGRNNTIKNFTMEVSAPAGDYVCGGLFGYIYGAATIKNLVIENATITATVNGEGQGHNVGVLVGFAYNKGGKANISNITVTGDVKVDAPNVYGVGSIVGYSYYDMGTIDNCKVLANEGSYIKGYSFVGGITGYSYSNAVISNCSVENLAITATSYSVGGIAGVVNNNNKIENCTVAETVTVNGQANVGSVVGAIGGDGSTLTIENCTAAEPMIGGNYGNNKAVVAKIGEKYYTLEGAVNAVQNGETITLIKDVTENVTLTEKTGLYYTIDGAGKTMNGTITVKSLSDTNDNRRITIKNINFVDTVNGRDFITSTETNHYPRLTVESCSFTGTGKEAANTVAIRLKSSHSVVIKDCTGTGLHSFLQNTSGWNLTIENVTVTNSKSALALGTVQGVTVKDSNIDVAGYGIRMDANTYNNNAVIESNTVKAFIPVVVRKANAESNITFQGTNTFSATNTDNIWCAIGTSEYEENGKLPTDATGKVTVALNDNGLDAMGVYGDYVALAGAGTETEPYLINTLKELEAFRASVNKGETKYNTPGVYVALNADIDLAGTTWERGIGDGINATFDGIFDGRNKTIKNLTMNPTPDSDGYVCGGLFGYIYGAATIKNLVIENATITATVNGEGQGHNVGVLVGFAYNKGGKANISNITVTGDVKVDAPNVYGVGSIVGYSYYDMGTIDNCKVLANEGSYIKGKRYVGGITGYSYDNAVITKCIVNNLALTGEIGVGGIAGLAKNGNNIAECTVTNVTVNGDKNVAYIVGELQGEGGSVIIADNNNAPQPWVGGSWGSGEPFVATIGTKYYTSIKDAIKAVKDNETIVLIRDITMDYNARDSYETQAQNIVIDGNDHTLTLNQKNSDWASIGLANNSKLVLNNMTIEKTGYGDTNGAWNTHAIIFSCPLEMNDVIVNNAIAVQAGAILNNVAINEANGYYGLWINGNGQSVTMNGGSITATNGGRGIKIADQYIDAPAQVTLNVTGTDFNTAKKAAVLVSSKAGAQIVASNVDITDVVADNVNFVWVDEDWAANFGNVEVTGATVAQEGLENFVAAVEKDAKVQAYYTSLQSAVNAVQNGETITLIKDVTENVTLTEKTGLYYTIDGAGKTMNGTITVKSLSDTNDNRRITIKNINFVDTVNGRDFITSTETNHYPRLTVEGCSFTGTGKEAANTVAIRLKSSHSVVIKDCTGTGLHSFLQNTSGWNLTIENVTVTESKSGLALGTVQGVTVKDCEIAVAGYGIRMDANTYNNNAVIESNTVEAFIPVVVRKANTNSNITFNGTNTMTATNTDGYWCVIGTSEYEENGQLPTAATGNVFVSLNDEALNYEGIYGHYAVAQIGDVKYATLQAAVNAVEDGGTITLIADEVFTKNNRYNNNGWWDGLVYSGDKSFTIDLAGYTIKQDGNLNDYLIWIKNDGSKDNTINIINGTIDAGTTAYSAFATASSNSNKITINTSDINFVGNNSSGAVLKIRGGAELNANAGTIITGKNNYVGIEVVGTNTVVNINEGVEIYQKGTSSYVGSLAGVSSGATLNVIGGKGTSAQGGFIAMTSGGTINVSGGEWIANTDGTYANSNKSVLIAQSDKQYNAGAGNSIINVTGGTFKGGYNCYGNAVGDAQINISGGNFNADPTTYVVDKYEVVEEANGTFTVKMASFEKFYTATGVETTTGGVFSLAFEPTSETEVSVKIGSKNPAVGKNYDLIIPSSVEFDGVTFAVTSIPEEGFKECKGFDKLVVPGTITSVSANAFYSCSRFKEITIEEGVQKLGAYSFYKNTALETLTLPSTLTKIESLCFRGVESTNITIVCNAMTPPTAFEGSFTQNVYNNALLYVAGTYEDYKAATGWKNFVHLNAQGATQVIVKKNYTLIATITDVWNRTCSVKIGTAPTNNRRAQLEIPEHVSFNGIEFDITSIPESGFQECKYFEGTLTIPAYITSIGRNAFNGCSGITELVVEEGVTSLGTYGTFEGCRDIETIILPSTLETVPTRCFQNIHQNLNTIVCNAMTPPTLSSNFSDHAINDGLTLYVHDVDAYKAAARWNQIKSIRLIGAVAQNMTTSREYKSLQEAINEAAGATVKVLDNVVLEEAITVAAGAEVTLDLNGKVVSYESAVVGEDMITNNGKLTVESSVAGGKITYNNTDETGANVTINTISTVAGSELIINGGIIENTSLANNTSKVLVPYAIDILTNGGLGDVAVTINGGEIVSTNYIAIRQFVNGNVCNNSLTVKGGTITGLKRAINVQDAQGNGQVKNCAKLLVEAGNIIAGEGGYAICNFANSENVALTGGNFVGTVYSAIDGIISGGTFSEEPYSGYLADGFICEPNADGTYSVIEEPIYTQTIQLNAGWNWFSSYVETDLESLQAALGTSGVQIKGKDSFTDYYNEYDVWYGGLTSIAANESMYIINMANDAEITLEGKMVDPETISIEINQYWNWIAYPLNVPMDVNVALANLDAKAGDQIKTKDAFADYYEGYGWYGSLVTLEPGLGYVYYSASEETTTFTYSTSTRRSEAKANVTTDGNYWIPNAAQFANNMTMTAVLDVENINYEVAAFVNGECRGSARPIYVEALDAYMLFLTIHGEEVEEMTFKYYDIDTDTEYTLSDRINYSNNAILGSLKEPYMFTRGTTGIGEAELSQLNIYPNPTTTAAEINLNATFDKVEVFNALGVKVAEYSNVDSIDALETAGIYVIRATNNSVISHCRLVVK